MSIAKVKSFEEVCAIRISLQLAYWHPAPNSHAGSKVWSWAGVRAPEPDDSSPRPDQAGSRR